MNNNTTIGTTTEFRMGAKRAQILRSILVFGFLVFFALIVLIPFYIISITAFMTEAEAASTGFSWWPREGFSLAAFDTVLFRDITGGTAGGSTVMRGFINTLIVVIPPTIIGLFTSALSGYAFAKMRFPLKKVFFTILLFTMMIPGVIMLVPTFIIYDILWLTDTYFPLMVPGMFGAAAAVFFLRQYFYGIPTELVESAKIDGKSHWGIFWTIMVPLSGGALAAQGILGFVGGYNDFMGPLIYIHSVNRWTLQLALSNMTGFHNHNWAVIAAGTVIALIPMLIIYIVAQRFFIEGIATTGLKV
ncbi:MAG: carbohydrate ABC transporter permease [Firmicutes bacterium]|nr:carbohydrate ABC transporter permease [Bacillota bacterium]